MARTVSGFQGSSCGAAAAALSPAASGCPALVAKPSAARTAMETRRLGSRKISLPVTVTADESPQDRAIAFFAAKSILETKARGVQCQRNAEAQSALPESCRVSGVAEKRTRRTPLSWEVGV